MGSVERPVGCRPLFEAESHIWLSTGKKDIVFDDPVSRPFQRIVKLPRVSSSPRRWRRSWTQSRLVEGGAPASGSTTDSDSPKPRTRRTVSISIISSTSCVYIASGPSSTVTPRRISTVVEAPCSVAARDTGMRVNPHVEVVREVQPH